MVVRLFIYGPDSLVFNFANSKLCQNILNTCKVSCYTVFYVRSHWSGVALERWSGKGDIYSADIKYCIT